MLCMQVGDAVKELQAEQEGLAANAALNSKLGKGGGGGATGGAPDSAVINLVMGSEERLQRAIQVRAYYGAFRVDFTDFRCML